MRRRIFFRGLAVLTAAAMLLGDPVFAAVVSVPVSRSLAAEPLGREALTSFRIPEALGTVESMWVADQPGRFVVILQDAHAVREAQAGIRGLLGFLHDQYGVRLAGVEGARAPLDMTVLRSFPDAFAREQVLQSYLDRGEFTGAQMAALDEADLNMTGIEDWDLYEKNYMAWLAASREREALEPVLNAVEERLSSERSRAFSTELKAYDENARRFYHEKMDLTQLAAWLNSMPPASAGLEGGTLAEALQENAPSLAAFLAEAGASQEEGRAETDLQNLSRDFLKQYEDRLPVESRRRFAASTQEYRTGQKDAPSYLQGLLQCGTEAGVAPHLTPALRRLAGRAENLSMIKGTRLFDELETLLLRMEQHLARSEEEAVLLAKFRRLRLLRDLAALELTPPQWSAWLEDPEAPLALLGAERAKIFPAIEFYQLATERDQAFHRNLNLLMERQGVQTAAVIAGGFHARGFEAFLRQEGISYAVVMPHMTNLEGHEHYAAVMLGDLSYRKEIRTTLFDAFMTDASRALAGRLNPAAAGRMLRLWRDAMLRSLAQEGKIAEAAQYTRYVDGRVPELFAKNGVPGNDFRERFFKNAEETLDQFGSEAMAALRLRLERMSEAFDAALQAGGGAGAVEDALSQMARSPSALQLPVVAATDSTVFFEPFISYVQTGQFDYPGTVTQAGEELVLSPVSRAAFEQLTGEFSFEPALSPAAREAVRGAARTVVRQIDLAASTPAEIRQPPAAAEDSLNLLVEQVLADLPPEVKTELREQGAFQIIMTQVRNELRAEKPSPEADRDLEILMQGAAQEIRAQSRLPAAAAQKRSPLEGLEIPALPEWLTRTAGTGESRFSELHREIAGPLELLIQRVDALLGYRQMKSETGRRQLEARLRDTRTYWIQTTRDGAAPEVPGLLSALDQQIRAIRYALSQVEDPARRRALLPEILAYLDGLRVAALWLARGQKTFTAPYMGEISVGLRIDYSHQRRLLQGRFAEREWDLAEEIHFRDAGILGKLRYLTALYRQEIESWKGIALEIPVPAPSPAGRPADLPAGLSDQELSDLYGLTLEPAAAEETGLRTELRAENDKVPGPDIDAIREFHEEADSIKGVMVSRTQFPEYLRWFVGQLETLKARFLPKVERPKLLSLGPGPGRTEVALQKRKSFAVDGVELTPGMAQKMAELARDQKVKVPVVIGNAADRLSKLPAASRDALLIGEGIGYYDPLDKLFRDAHRALSADGFIAITTYPVPKGQEFLASRTHYIQYPPEEIMKELGRAGFQNVEIKILKYDDFQPLSDIHKRFSKRPDGVVVLLITAQKKEVKSWLDWAGSLWSRLRGGAAQKAAAKARSGTKRAELRTPEPSALKGFEAYWQAGAVTSLGVPYAGPLKEIWVRFFEGLPENAAILDVGTGRLPVPMIGLEVSRRTNKHLSFTASDPVPVQKENLPGSEAIAFYQALAEDLSFAENSAYDAVTSMWGLEYASDFPIALSEINRVLKTNGTGRFVIHHPESILVQDMKKFLSQMRYLHNETILEDLFAAAQAQTKSQDHEALINELSGYLFNLAMRAAHPGVQNQLFGVYNLLKKNEAEGFQYFRRIVSEWNIRRTAGALMVSEAAQYGRDDLRRSFEDAGFEIEDLSEFRGEGGVLLGWQVAVRKIRDAVRPSPQLFLDASPGAAGLRRFFPAAGPADAAFREKPEETLEAVHAFQHAELRQTEEDWNAFRQGAVQGLFAGYSDEEILGLKIEDFTVEVEAALGLDLSEVLDSRLLASRLIAAAARIFLGQEAPETVKMEDLLNEPALQMLRLAARIPDAVWQESFQQLSVEDYPREADAVLFAPASLRRVLPVVLDAAFSPVPGEADYLMMEKAIRGLVERGIPVAVPYEIGTPHEKVVEAWRQKFGAAHIFGRPYRDGVLDLAALNKVQFGAGYYGIFKSGVRLEIPAEQGDLSEQAFYAPEWYARSEAAGGAAGFLELSLRVLASPYLRQYLEKGQPGDPAVMTDQAFQFMIRFFNDLARTAAIRAVVEAAA